MKTKEQAQSELSKLTDRQREVCTYVAMGLESREIAHVLDIDEMTVRAHRYQSLKRLHITSSVQLAVIFTIAGVVTDWIQTDGTSQ